MSHLFFYWGHFIIHNLILFNTCFQKTEYGKGYKWKPQIAHIVVGDIVYWKWQTSSYVLGVKISVQQTADEESTDYNGMGFKHKRPSLTGKLFLYQD